MQKFTAFSILFALSVVFLMADALWNGSFSELETQTPSELQEVSSPEILELPTEMPAEETPVDILPVVEPTEDLESSVTLSETLGSQLEEGLFVRAGFSKAVLKDSLFSGLVFQFISFNDQNDATLYQWNLFDGELYVGSITEVRYPTETSSFQAYLTLRERASALPQLGEVNEVNNYGDTSFYFNHKTKTKTIHIVIRKGRELYAFEYSSAQHEKMKKVFDILGANL